MTDATKRPIPQLMPASMKLSEQEVAVYVATVTQQVTRKDLLEPSFWCHVAQQLRPRYEIKVFSEDDSFYAHYLVIACDKTWARVHEINYQNLNTTQFSEEQLAKILEDYDVSHRGPHKWSVIRKTDRAVLQEKMHSKEDAYKWLMIHLNSQTRTAAA